MSEESRPCPFCGGEAHECLDNHFDCLNPGCPMAGARAIPLENWNTRPIEDALTARIAELEAEVTKGHELQDAYCDRIAELEELGLRETENK